jgi:LMBR1 domain-containing protein 1
LVTIIAIISLTSLLATVLLLPVDIALVSSTTSSKLGRRKDWASQDKVDNIVQSLEIVYYLLYSLDALLCLVIIPFTYFWYEEQDDTAEYEDRQSFGKRFWDAFKYTIVFILLVVILFLVGFFVPIARSRKGDHWDLDYFKKLLAENRGERALTFALGLLITIGTLLYVAYTAPGLALLPVKMIKKAPTVSSPTLIASTESALEANRERQRQLEGRNVGNTDGLSTKDRRELENLVREERTLVRRERLAHEASGEGKGKISNAWRKIGQIFRPFALIGGILLLFIIIFVWVSMLLTSVDKAKNSVCGVHCGYVLGRVNIFNPLNWIFGISAKVFPVDYVLVTLLVLLFFSGTVVGLGSIGIRFLW